jgi:hypothetical protein
MHYKSYWDDGWMMGNELYQWFPGQKEAVKYLHCTRFRKRSCGYYHRLYRGDAGKIFQIWDAYSRTALSLENFPIPAVFNMDRRFHSSVS